MIIYTVTFWLQSTVIIASIHYHRVAISQAPPRELDALKMTGCDNRHGTEFSSYGIVICGFARANIKFIRLL